MVKKEGGSKVALQSVRSMIQYTEPQYAIAEIVLVEEEDESGETNIDGSAAYSSVIRNDFLLNRRGFVPKVNEPT